jgi:hypothetical protein
MAHPAVASFQIHPNRSTAACAQLIAAWRGLLVRDGYIVSLSPGKACGRAAWRL